MISERRFCASYTSVWAEILPYSDRYIRRLNLELDTFSEPISPPRDASILGVVNESAFRIVELSVNEHLKLSKYSDEKLYQIIINVVKWLHNGEVPASIISNKKLTISDVRNLAKNLHQFLCVELSGSISFRPQFLGCGVIDESEGDVVVGDMLVEVKSGDRNFLSVDLRQIITYCALEKAATGKIYNQICLVNPRIGRYWVGSLSDVAEGCGSPNVLQMLDDVISSMMYSATSTV